MSDDLEPIDAPHYPYPDNEGRTHYEDCYRYPRHHNCAVRRCDRLADDLSTAADELARSEEDNDRLRARVAELENNVDDLEQACDTLCEHHRRADQ